MSQKPAETPGSEPPLEARSSNAVAILLTGTMAIALVGYVVGIGQPHRAVEAPQTKPTPAQGSIGPALSYEDLRTIRRGPNADWESRLATQSFDAELLEQVTIEPGQKAAGLAARAKLRAFNGAPPTIPHTVESHAAESCLQCHENGLRLGELVAPGMPHELLTNCTQCHVPSLADQFELATPAESTFVGLEAPFAGKRAWPGAPPTIPHTTAMRSNCLACHGPRGNPGLQTTHPWRQSCLQCHAPAAELDQQPGSSSETARLLPPPQVQ